MSSSSNRHPYTALTPVTDVYPGRSEDDAENAKLLQTEDQDDAPIIQRQSMRQFRQFFNDNTGLLLVACSQAFFAVMNTAVKELNSLSPPVSTLELVLVRMFITYFCGIVYMLWTKVEDPWIGPKGVRLLLALRGFFGFFGLFGIYYSLQYLSLSDATVLTFLAPLCTGIAGSLVLNERFTWREATAGVLSFFGVVLIARPAFLFGHFHAVTPSPTPTLEDYLRARAVDVTPEQRLVAVGVALVGVLGSTGAYTSIRAIGTRAHPIHMMSSFSFQCVVVSSIAMVATKTPFVIPTRLLWLSLLALIGIFGFLAQILLTMGLQRETAGRGTMAVYTLIIFSSILDRIFFHSIPSLLSVLGTLIIMASAIWVGISKKNGTTQDEEEVVQLSKMVPKSTTNKMFETPETLASTSAATLEDGLLHQETESRAV